MEIQFSIPLARPKKATSSGRRVIIKQRRGRHPSLRSRISYQTHPPELYSRAHRLCDIKRHVKCDETRPACLNCIKWRGYCDSSYADSGAPDHHHPPKGTGHSDDHHTNLIHTEKAAPLLLLTEPLVNTLRFASQDQRAYFDEWASLSVTFLSGGLQQTRLWTATMPQLSLEEPTLRCGAMAVGALRRACREAAPGNAPAALTKDNRHYLDAVVLYCEALRLQSKAQPTRDGLRTALLSSLLFICFEAQRGNMPAALKHVTHGFSMLNELAGCAPRAPDLVSIAPAPPAMVQEILDCYKPLELQSRSFLGSYTAFFFKGDGKNRPGAPPPLPVHPGQQPPPRLMSPTSSPQRPVVNVQSPASDPSTPQSQQTEMLSPRSLDSPSSLHTTPVAPPPPPSSTSAPSSSCPSATNQPGPGQQGPGALPPRRPPGIAPFTKHSPYFRPKRTTITTLHEMPRVFKDMEETQGYWALVQRNMVQYLPLLTATSAQLALAKATSEAQVAARLAAIRQDPGIGKFIAECRYWIQRWTEAYEPLYQGFLRRRHERPPTAYLHAINLRIEYLILYIYTTVPRYSGLITARGLTPQYREITELAETLLRARPQGGFAMDSGWTWPLFIAAFGCRDPAVRADATRILGEYPIRNALRDSRVYRAIALRNEEVERAIAADGDDEARQWVRLRRREVLFEDFGASVVLRSVRKDEATGVWEPVEEIADFQVRPDGHLNWRRQPISDATSILGGVC